MAGAAEIVAARCRRLGSVSFEELMEVALYDDGQGFYASGGQAGRRGDFLTSPEVGPLFGAVVANALDEWWAAMDRPDPYLVVECGAGSGMLARTVLRAAPACAPALRYVLVERSAALRARHGEHLDLTPPELALGPTVRDADGIEQCAAPGSGPVTVSLAALPAFEGPVVVLANELLDNLPFALLQRTGHGWDEVRVGLDPAGRQLVEQPVVASAEWVAQADALAADAPFGGRIPLQRQAAAWLRSALELASPGGRVVVFDYMAASGTLAERPWRDWLRTYAGQARGGGPLELLGAQDITADVCRDQLAKVRAPSIDCHQADWLARHGIAALVDEGRAIWHERARVGDLAAMWGRSRIGEADALCDPAGLGGFAVLEWLA